MKALQTVAELWWFSLEHGEYVTWVNRRPAKSLGRFTQAHRRTGLNLPSHPTHKLPGPVYLSGFSPDEEVAAGELGVAGEVDAESAQSGFVSGGRDVCHVDLASPEALELRES